MIMFCLQANQCKSSTEMELRGAQDCFTFLEVSGLAVLVFVSDRHRSIAKWIRENLPNTKHFYDIWHVAKSIQKKILKVGKESGCAVLTKWQKAIKNHLYWCATSTKIGFEELILAKRKSLIRHISNKHKNHPDRLFTKCTHPRLTQRRDWIKVGMYHKSQMIPILTTSHQKSKGKLVKRWSWYYIKTKISHYTLYGHPHNCPERCRHYCLSITILWFQKKYY